MRLRLQGLSRPEDRFEDWIAQGHQQRVLEGNATPTGPCPDEAFLKKLGSAVQTDPTVCCLPPFVGLTRRGPNSKQQLADLPAFCTLSRKLPCRVRSPSCNSLGLGLSNTVNISAAPAPEEIGSRFCAEHSEAKKWYG